MIREFIGIMGKLTCELGEEMGVAIVTLGGQADVYTSPEMSKILDAYINRGQGNIILDLGDLEYLDSSTLAALIRAQKKAKNLGGEIKLLKLEGEPRKVFEVSGFLAIFDTFSNREEALKSFKIN